MKPFGWALALMVVLTSIGGAFKAGESRGYLDGYEAGCRAERRDAGFVGVTMTEWGFEVTPDTIRITRAGRIALKGYWLADNEAVRYVSERLPQDWRELDLRGGFVVTFAPGVYGDTTGGRR